eukprot:6172585-Pleurochrysis_carterae.AAC.4
MAAFCRSASHSTIALYSISLAAGSAGAPSLATAPTARGTARGWSPSPPPSLTIQQSPNTRAYLFTVLISSFVVYLHAYVMASSPLRLFHQAL